MLQDRNAMFISKLTFQENAILDFPGSVSSINNEAL